MGSIELPPSGIVFIDAQIAIYAVERHLVYSSLIRPLWLAGQADKVQLAASELIILETLVGPLRSGERQTAQNYETLWQSGVIGLYSVSQTVLRDAAKLRAKYHSLRTPDAIHATTAIQAGASLFLTNDFNFRQVTELHSIFLDDLLES